MYFRIKRQKNRDGQSREYLCLAQTCCDKGRVRQKTLATLGRLDQLRESGNLRRLADRLNKLLGRLELVDLAKYENVYLKGDETIPDAATGLKEYFDFYNLQRHHQSLDYKTPGNPKARRNNPVFILKVKILFFIRIPCFCPFDHSLYFRILFNGDELDVRMRSREYPENLIRESLSYRRYICEIKQDGPEQFYPSKDPFGLRPGNKVIVSVLG